MQPSLRRHFDVQLEAVLAKVPPRVTEVLKEVPVYVEDYPSREQLDNLGLHHREQLCGLYVGVPLPNRSINQSGILSDVIYLFREGILGQSLDREGYIDDKELRVQIRKTLLHEIGHHHGLTETELEDLGYG